MSMVLSERRGSITILTLNNPEQYNALGGSLLNDLDAALEAALQEPRARAIVITGAGKGFCSGAQLGGGDTFSRGRAASPRVCEARSTRSSRKCAACQFQLSSP